MPTPAPAPAGPVCVVLRGEPIYDTLRRRTLAAESPAHASVVVS